MKQNYNYDNHDNRIKEIRDILYNNNIYNNGYNNNNQNNNNNPMFFNNNNNIQNIQNNQQINNNNNNLRDSLILGIRKTKTNFHVEGSTFRKPINLFNVSSRSSINSSKEISYAGISDLKINRQSSSNGTNITNDLLNRFWENKEKEEFTEAVVNEISPKKDNPLLDFNPIDTVNIKKEEFTEAVVNEIIPEKDNSWLNYDTKNKKKEEFTNAEANEIVPNADNPSLINIFSDSANIKNKEKENSIENFGVNEMLPKDKAFETNKSNIEKNKTTDVGCAQILSNNDENNFTNSKLNNNSKNTTNGLINGRSNKRKSTNISINTNYEVDKIILNKKCPNPNQLNQPNAEANEGNLYYTEETGRMYYAKF